MIKNSSMQLEMIPCPRCREDFPKLRLEKYGYNFCVNCSTEEPLVGITTVEGSGDSTFNDLIIMPLSKANAIAKAEAEIKGKKLFIQDLDLSTDSEDEDSDTQLKESVRKVLDDEDVEEEEEASDASILDQLVKEKPE